MSLRTTVLYEPILTDYHQSAAGLYVPGRKPRRPKALDLFAGCGGFSLGFHQAGWHVVAALEFDYFAAITYMTNLARPGVQIHFDTDERREGFEKALQKEMKLRPGKDYVEPLVAGSGWIRDRDGEPGCEHFWIADVRNVTGAEILDALGMEVGELDCVFGGPPCQGFSTAGKRNVMDPRNSLVFEFARLVCELQPRTTVMENVPAIRNMITPEGMPVVDEFCRILEAGDYAGHEALVKALRGMEGARAIARKRKPAKDPEPRDDESAAEQLTLAVSP